MNISPELFPLFFLVAFLYASVGHGGASGYLALFALFGIASPEVAPLALFLNIIVASTSWWFYYKNNFFSWKILLPFVVTSIPAAFVGGMIPISQKIFSLLLGFSLVAASTRMFFLSEVKGEIVEEEKNKLWKFGIPIGLFLGLLSGLVGIGGGVFLSPLLLFMKWTDAKRTAAIASAFIVLNSLSGIAGHLTRSSINFVEAIPLTIVVFVGGFLGSRYGATKLNQKTLQYLLAIVLLVAGIKMVFR